MPDPSLVLKPVHGRIFSEDVVAHFGASHCLAHLAGWFGHCVAAKIDVVHFWKSLIGISGVARFAKAARLSSMQTEVCGTAIKPSPNQICRLKSAALHWVL